MGKIENFIKVLKSVYKPSSSLPIPDVQSGKDVAGLSDIEKDVLKKFGISMAVITNELDSQLNINYDRRELYREFERAREHWLCAAAMELFADSATSTNPLHNATVWVTSENSKYEEVLNKLLDTISIEERIYDWAWNIGTFGDLFVRPICTPGLGIIAIDDTEHPINITRLDVNGQLIGFINSEDGNYSGDMQLQAPWSYTHFRLVGAKVKRPLDNDPKNVEFRAVHLLAPDTRQTTSRYGTSLLMNALPVYKRLRLAEDCLLMSRLTRGVVKYIYKVKVDGNNAESVSAIIDEYVGILKRARSVDTTVGAETYKSRTNMLSSVEDIIVPVFGDIGDLTVDSIGGDADIKWIVDIEELRNQLSAALRVPVALLGGHVDEASGSLGSESMTSMDIRFSRSVRRIQRSLKEGLLRLCQIHLAYLGMSPDVNMFDIQFSESSTEEEKQIKESLDVSVDVIQKYMDMIDKIDPMLDKKEIFNYLNKKILKFNDFDLEKIKVLENPPMEAVQEKKLNNESRVSHYADINAFLPEHTSTGEFTHPLWESKYKNAKITIKD